MTSVAIVFGGQSCEHEVSIKSACSLLNHIDRAVFSIEPIYIDHAGQWWQFPQKSEYAPSDFERTTVAQRCVLLPDSSYQLVQLPSLVKIPCDVIFPIVHGSNGEDGVLQGLLELANIPYVGANVTGSAVAMDKVMMKSIFKANHIPTADYLAFDLLQWEQHADSILEQATSLEFPLFIKPANAGSSIGISKCSTDEALRVAIENALKFDRKVLIEQGIAPARELEMAVLGNDVLQTSRIGEINPPDGIYDYAAKYLNNTAELHYPAEVASDVELKMQNIAKAAYSALGLRGLTRVDFLLDTETNEPYILEVNTLPGFTAISMYPKLWDVSGKPYKALISELIELALEAHREKQQRQLDFSAELAALQASLVG